MRFFLVPALIAATALPALAETENEREARCTAQAEIVSQAVEMRKKRKSEATGARSCGMRASPIRARATCGRLAPSIRKKPRLFMWMTARATTIALAVTPRATRSLSCAKPRMSASWRRSKSWPGEAGMQMPARDPKAQEKADRRTELAEVMEQAVQFFACNSKPGPGRRRAGLSGRRGMRLGNAGKFEIGFAPTAGRTCGIT